MDLPIKKRKRSTSPPNREGKLRGSSLTSLGIPISPPRRRAIIVTSSDSPEKTDLGASSSRETPKSVKLLCSPIQLTRIRDLPATANVDTVSIQDVLGDPLIAECWDFNYLHDLDFLMAAFDSDVRDLVKVKVIHGFWKREDASRVKLESQALLYPNVQLLTAYMPEPFGTHHSKMLILFRHDDTAQVIIHTANMIAKDWENMTQGVWKSPILPLLPEKVSKDTPKSMGSGAKFKVDLLNYLRAYNSKRSICKSLMDKLILFDFSKVRGALVASTPGRHYIQGNNETLWAWQGLQQVLKHVPVKPGKTSEIVVQISSVATLGKEPKWLQNTLFEALASNSCQTAVPRPLFKIIFPTADEIQRSLDGYASGGSIHMKIQTPAQATQLQYMNPMLHHWAGDGAQHSNDPPRPNVEMHSALRKRAAPHIKTYLRFSDSRKEELDWALLTSANLSTQAWGAALDKAGEVRVCSWEIGVLVWPELYGEGVKMVPTFQTDMPTARGEQDLVGLRMPYDLPLVPYGATDKPWCATAEYAEPDWMGRTWQH